mgnify:CR=1 FL=1
MDKPKVEVQGGDSAERKAFRTRQVSRLGFLTVLVIAIATALFAGNNPGATPSPSPTTHKVRIVASTTVWSSIANAIGGDFAEVQPVIWSPNQDPHSYEMTPRDQLLIRSADIVIMNGGGYDDFMNIVVQDGRPQIKINAFKVASRNANRNEHIWYDLEQTRTVAREIADSIEAKDPNHKTEIQANLATFENQLDTLTKESLGIVSGLDNLDVIETEPVADYLLTSMGFNNATPSAFAKAIEEERDVPPLALKEVQDAIKYASINFLAMNPNTETAQTNALAAQAKRDGVAVIYFAEQQTSNGTYIDWMRSNIAQVRKLVGVGK